MKKAFSIVVTSLLVIVIIFAVMLAGVRLFGITPYTVLSGSMEPNVHVGSLIYSVKVDPASLKERDVITYVIEGGTVVTHRIIEIIPDEDDPSVLRFRTKGDNNNTADLGEPIHQDNVLGKMIFTIPLIGYVAWFVQNPPGSYLTIGLGIVLILLTFLPDLIDKIDPMPPIGQKETEGSEGDAPAEAKTTVQLQAASETVATVSEHIPLNERPPNEEKIEPIIEETVEPVVEETIEPIVEETVEPVVEETIEPIVEEIVEPIVEETVEPVVEEIVEPIVEETVEPVVEETVEPVVEETIEPIVEETVEQIVEETVEPIVEETVEPYRRRNS